MRGNARLDTGDRGSSAFTCSVGDELDRCLRRLFLRLPEGVESSCFRLSFFAGFVGVDSPAWMRLVENFVRMSGSSTCSLAVREFPGSGFLTLVRELMGLPLIVQFLRVLIAAR
jgi:hypothetical protein